MCTCLLLAEGFAQILPHPNTELPSVLCAMLSSTALVRGSLDSAQISEAEATEPRLSSDLEQSTLLQPPEPRRYYLLSEATIILPEL